MKRIIAIASAVLVVAGIAFGFALTGSTAQATPLPALTTVAAAYTVPGTTLSVAPQPVSKLAAQGAAADTAVRALCATPEVGVGCYNSTPASIQFILFSDHHDPSSLLTNEPAYLLQWPLTGKACLLGLGGPVGADEATLASNAICTFSVAVDAATQQQIDSWEN